MLEVEKLSVFHGDAQALEDVSLSVAEGTIVAIVGANGAGKTSLIRTIAGMHRPASGRIVFQGVDIAGLPSHRVCDLGVGQVAEGRQIFPSLTVAENLDMGAMLSRARRDRLHNRDRVQAMFPKLAERLGQAAGTLSGGEQQMLAIARCIMGDPQAHHVRRALAGDSRRRWSMTCSRPFVISMRRASPACWSNKMSRYRSGSPTMPMCSKTAG